MNMELQNKEWEKAYSFLSSVVFLYTVMMETTFKFIIIEHTHDSV